MDKNRQRKPPRAAAVAIRTRSGNVSYAEALKKARQEISLRELGIEVTKIRRGMDGSVMIEIPGLDGREKANMLAGKLREKLNEDDIIITRPIAMAEIKISGLDASITKEEVKDIIVEYGDCGPEEIKIGEIRELYNGLGMIWARCPIGAANRLLEIGRVRIGWTVARIELLARRPIQCFKCWEFGHVRFACKGGVDRTGLCFKCGTRGHTLKECRSEETKCVICEEKGYQCNHRIGSRWCKSIKQTERGRVGLRARGNRIVGKRKETTSGAENVRKKSASDGGLQNSTN